MTKGIKTSTLTNVKSRHSGEPRIRSGAGTGVQEGTITLKSSGFPAYAGNDSGSGYWIPPYQVRGRLIKPGMTVLTDESIEDIRKE